jgi:hypothetical protein
VAEVNIGNTNLLEAWEAIFKYDEKGRKKGEKGEKSDGKKGGQYAFIRNIFFVKLGLNVI